MQTKVEAVSRNEAGGEVSLRTWLFETPEEARRFVTEHEQDFADDPEIYAIYIKYKEY